MQNKVSTKDAPARKGSKNPKPPKPEKTAEPVSYWDSPQYAADLAALDAKGEEGLFVAPHLAQSVRALLALLEGKPFEKFHGSIEDYFANSGTGGCYHAHKGTLRLLRALLDEVELRIAESVLREHKYVAGRLQEIEGAAILAECEALANR